MMKLVTITEEEMFKHISQETFKDLRRFASEIDQPIPYPITKAFYARIKELPDFKEYTKEVAGVTIHLIGTSTLPEDQWYPVYIMPEFIYDDK